MQEGSETEKADILLKETLWFWQQQCTHARWIEAGLGTTGSGQTGGLVEG